jgi:hypothetical protein
VVTDFLEASGVAIKPVEDVTTLDSYDRATKAVQARMRAAKGWYDPDSGELVINLAKNVDTDDVKATIAHEIVGHRSIRDIIGNDKMDDFLMEVYEHMTKEVRDKVVEKWRSSKAKDILEATEEYLADLAMKDFEEFTPEEATLWGRLRKVISRVLNNFFEKLKLPKWLRLGDKELRQMLRYMWEESPNNPNNRGGGNGGVFKKARDIARDEEARVCREEDSAEADNKRFNEQLDQYLSGALDIYEPLNLGHPAGAMELFLPDIPILSFS